MKLTYLLIDTLSFLFPFAWSWHPRISFHLHFKPYLKANFIVAILFIAWDIYFTAKGVWGFNDKYVTGLYLYGLPIEEILFFFCIPFACLFTWHWLSSHYELKMPAYAETVISLLLVAGLLALGLFHHEKYYTSWCFISCAILLFYVKFIRQVSWLGPFYYTWLVLLIPFFIVNGLLTGTGPDEAVVWYNDTHNLGIRMLSIPVEDLAYGFELILLTTCLYEHFRSLEKT